MINKILITIASLTMILSTSAPLLAAPPFAVYPQNWMSAPVPQITGLWSTEFGNTTPRPADATGILVSPRVVLEAGHTIYRYEFGYATSHKFMRANYGSRTIWLTQWPEQFPYRVSAMGSLIRRSYRLSSPGSLESRNSDFSVAYRFAAQSPFHNSAIRMKVADPNGVYPHTWFRERPNSWQVVRGAARSLSRFKLMMCYPTGYYGGFSQSPEYKLHWHESHISFSKVASTHYDGWGLRNAWYYTDAVKAGGGCSGGGLINHESGAENLKLLGTVISSSNSRPTGVRLGDSKVLRLARQVALLAHP